jgi:hypothetical protein
MSEPEIRKVFETLQLPQDRPAAPPPNQLAQPIVYFTISGDSPPLTTR